MEDSIGDGKRWTQDERDRRGLGVQGGMDRQRAERRNGYQRDRGGRMRDQIEKETETRRGRAFFFIFF